MGGQAKDEKLVHSRCAKVTRRREKTPVEMEMAEGRVRLVAGGLEKPEAGLRRG